MPRLAFVVVSVSLASACALFPSLDGLTGGVADAGQPPDGECAACVDAAAADSGADADADAQLDDAAPTPFCASLKPSPKFCEDFDQGGSFSSQFTSTHMRTGSLGADGKAFTSPPQSLFVMIPVGSTPGDYAFMTRLFAGSASSVTYGFEVRVDSWVTGGKSGVLGSIVIDDSTATQHALSFYVTDAYAAVEEVFVQGTTQYLDHTLASNVKLGVWTRVELSLDLTNRTCGVTLGGSPVLTNAPLDSSWAAGTPAVDLGMTYSADDSSAWNVRYDDVTVDWK